MQEMEILYNNEISDDILIKFQEDILAATCAKDSADNSLTATELTQLFLSKMDSSISEVKI